MTRSESGAWSLASGSLTGTTSLPLVMSSLNRNLTCKQGLESIKQFPHTLPSSQAGVPLMLWEVLASYQQSMRQPQARFFALRFSMRHNTAQTWT